MLNCVVCQQSFADAELLFGDRGRTCAACVVDEGESSDETRRLWTEIVGPPALAFCSVVALCVPLVGVVLAPLLATVSLLGGLNALMRGYRLNPEEEGLDPKLRVYLLVSGGISTVVSLALVAWFFLIGVLLVASMLMR